MYNHDSNINTAYRAHPNLITLVIHELMLAIFIFSDFSGDIPKEEVV